MAAVGEFSLEATLQDVAREALKRLNHPEVGQLTIEYDVLTPLGDPGQRLVAYRAADAASQRALDVIARLAADRQALCAI